MRHSSASCFYPFNCFTYLHDRTKVLQHDFAAQSWLRRHVAYIVKIVHFSWLISNRFLKNCDLSTTAAKTPDSKLICVFALDKSHGKFIADKTIIDIQFTGIQGMSRYNQADMFWFCRQKTYFLSSKVVTLCLMLSSFSWFKRLLLLTILTYFLLLCRGYHSSMNRNR